MPQGELELSLLPLDASPPAPPPRRIAIIGGGCAGTLLAVNLLRAARTPLQVVVIERRSVVGPGLAYSTTSDEHRLNVPAKAMSAFPAEPGHFLDWVNARWQELNLPCPPSPDAFVQRRVYGAYLRDLLAAAVRQASAGVTLEHVEGEAVDIVEQPPAPTVLLAGGATVAADTVVLALGNLPGEYPIKAPLPFYHGPRYVHSPLMERVLDGVAPEDDLLIVGAGLTAVDIIVASRRRGHRGIIHALSRRGIHPHVHRTGLPKLPPMFGGAGYPTRIRELFRLVRRRVAAAAAEGADWRCVIDSLRADTPGLWQALPAEERARFMRHVRPVWDAVRHRVPPETDAVISELERNGKVKFYAGRLVALREVEGGSEAVMKPKGRGHLVTLRVAKVVNCTGPRTDYSKFQHPLLTNLLAAGLIGHDPLALGLDALPDGSVCRYRSAPSGWLFTLGAPMKGILWECTAVPEIRVQAAALAQRLLAAPAA